MLLKNYINSNIENRIESGDYNPTSLKQSIIDEMEEKANHYLKYKNYEKSKIIYT